jgi:hypothetical protein
MDVLVAEVGAVFGVGLLVQFAPTLKSELVLPFQADVGGPAETKRIVRTESRTMQLRSRRILGRTFNV